jgi:hypothetical protein
MNKFLMAGLAATVISVALAGNASAVSSTTVTTKDAFLGNGSSFWDGTVKSASKACALNRSVTVFQVKAGADKKIGTTKAQRVTGQPGYHWTLEARFAITTGKYYAVAKPTASCGGDTSNVLNFVLPPR